jgi:O-antigen ligase
MDRARDFLRPVLASPAALPTLAAVAILVVWAASDGGYPTKTWYPGAIFLVGLLVATAAVLPLRLREVPPQVLVAAGLLALFTIWSFCSISWADAKGEAWDGANRTLLYLVVFALFALWSQRGEGAAVVLGTWTLALIVLGAVTLVRVTDSSQPEQFLVAFRLAEPAGYASATSALFMMAVWPALMLAGRREVPWALRGIYAGGAVLLLNLAALTQSRGAAYSLPIVLALFFVLVPGRRRSFVVLIPIVAAMAFTGPDSIEAASRMRDGGDTTHELAQVANPMVLAALAVAALVALVTAVADRPRRFAPEIELRVARTVGWVGIGCAVGVLAVGAVAMGNPRNRAESWWDSFREGPVLIQPKRGNRLSAGLGSARYDFYRVALNRFRDNPLQGTGADNYAADYLLRGRSQESPRYPHSVEMRTLAQTGLVGALLLLGCIVAALWGAVLAVRRRPGPLGAATAGGAAMVFVYWLVHGSFDWFWEFAGLGSAAWAMLGLACALAPRREAAPAPAPRPWLMRVAGVGTAVVALAATASLASPWLAERDIRRAARGWPADLGAAYSRLDRADEMNPLSDRPALIEGSIALRTGDFDRAERAFHRALERDPRGVYANLELGAIASQRNRPVDALRHLQRAADLAPRDRIIRRVLARVQAGKRLSIAELNREILSRANALSA